MDSNNNNNNQPTTAMDLKEKNKTPFTIEDFLRSAKLPEKDKEQLVKKYADLLSSKGLSEESQLPLLTEERLLKYGVLEMHAAAIADAALNWGTKGGLLESFSALSVLEYSDVLQHLFSNYGHLIKIPQRVPAQQSDLGPFAKGVYPLPHRGGLVDMRLDHFANMQERLPAARTILDSLAALPQEPGSRKLISIIGGSGYGKTTSLMEVGSHHFMVFFKCGVAGGADVEDHFVQQGWSDSNFISMVNQIDVEFANKNEDAARVNASTIFLRHLTARLLLLRIMFQTKPTLTPEDFLMFQLDGGRTVIEVIHTTLRNVVHSEIVALLGGVFLDLYKNLKGKRIVCTFDEANVGYEWACKGKFKSPKNGFPRGLLSSILQTFATTSFGLSILLAGTFWTLGQAENVESDVGEKYGSIDQPITVFKLNMESDVVEYFSTRIDLDGCGDIKSLKDFEYLIGRGRLCAKVLELIPGILVRDPSIPKKGALELAIIQSVELHRSSIAKNMVELWRSSTSSDILRRIYVGSLFGQYFIFSGKQSSQFDPIHLGISKLEQIIEGGIYWRIVEKLVTEVILQTIQQQTSEVYETLRFHLNLLERSIQEFGPNIQFKGNLLERMMASCFLLPAFQNICISELPFIKAAELTLPDWCKNTPWVVKQVCTPNSLGFVSPQKSENDIDALYSSKAIGTCLYLTQVLGPEFIVRLGPTGQYWITAGLKLYSKKVPSNVANSNIGITTYKSMETRCPKDLRAKFKNIPCKGTLRIIVHFPCAPSNTTYCSKVSDTDVQLYIDQTNARTFFSSLGNEFSNSLIAMLAECTETSPADWK